MSRKIVFWILAVLSLVCGVVWSLLPELFGSPKFVQELAVLVVVFILLSVHTALERHFKQSFPLGLGGFLFLLGLVFTGSIVIYFSWNRMILGVITLLLAWFFERSTIR